VMNLPFTAVDTPERKLLFYPAEGEPEEIEVPEQSLYLGEVDDMNAAILDATPNYLTLAETRNHVRTTLALYEAARNGRVVHLSEF